MAGANEAILLFVVILTAFAGGSLLFWSWVATPGERLLLFSSLSCLLAAISAAVFYSRDFRPDALTGAIGYALSLEGFALIYAGFCVFNGRPVPLRMLVAAPVVWLVGYVVPGIAGNEPARVALSSLIGSLLLLTASREAVRLRDGIRARRALAVLFGLHAFAISARVPIVLFAVPAFFEFQGPWFLLVMAELLFFLQMSCYLIVNLPKERLELVLKHAAHTDLLTGLPNRRAFFDRSERILKRAAPQNPATSIILFDLDRFKKINDTFGHATGDAVLVAFADILRKMLRAGDICARLGGEEFVAFIPESGEQAARLAAERIVRAFEIEGAVIEGRRVDATVSAGVASFSSDLHSLDKMLRVADDALYQAKLSVRNRVAVAGGEIAPKTAQA